MGVWLCSWRLSLVLGALRLRANLLRNNLAVFGLGRVGLLGAGRGRRDRTGCVLARLRLDLRELLVRRNAAEARAGQRRVRAALAVREERRATAAEVRVSLAAEGRLGLLLRELGVGDDVDLPAGEPRGEAGVQALLADRERKLVVGNNDGRVARSVVDVDLAHPRRRQRLRDEPGGLGVPRDDVDLPAARHSILRRYLARPAHNNLACCAGRRSFHPPTEEI